MKAILIFGGLMLFVYLMKLWVFYTLSFGVNGVFLLIAPYFAIVALSVTYGKK